VDGGVSQRFLQRGGVRAALAWLTVATAPAGDVPASALREAARRPKRGMSASLLDLVSRKGSVEGLAGLAVWLEGKGSEREAGKVEKFAADLALARRAGARGTTADVLTVLRTRIGDGGLDASASALDEWSHGASAAHGDDLDALGELAGLQDDPAQFPGWLADQLSLPSDTAGVLLASIHAVKGREWPHVVVHHATDGLLPHRLADDVEEERRVFHVALTRCRSSVSVVPGLPPSPFLAELDEPGTPSASTPAPPATRVRRAEPAATPQRRQGPAAEALPGEPGATFTYRGYQHEVVEIVGSGVRARVGEGPATTLVPFGTAVDVGAREVVVTHPCFAEAWERLRTWRTGRSAGKPAYVVFDDKTLWLIAAILPTTEAGLLAISGIGPVKLETYGDDLISIAEELRSA
jgi:DNA helicase-2/ATP-dependent DNA helicase PcrA